MLPIVVEQPKTPIPPEFLQEPEPLTPITPNKNGKVGEKELADWLVYVGKKYRDMRSQLIGLIRLVKED